MNFSGKFGNVSTIWYPASGCRSLYDGNLNGVGSYFGHYWSASPYSNGSYRACSLVFFDYEGNVYPSSGPGRADGLSVRCLQE